MDNRMLERIVIIILLLLNGFLAAVVLSDRVETRRSNAEITEYVMNVLDDNGITAAEGAFAVQAAPKRVTLVRSSQKESEIVRRLLGKAEPQDQGGNIIFYRTDRGQAVFRGSGEMDALLSSGTIPLHSDVEKAVSHLLNKVGIDAKIVMRPEKITDGTVEAYCCWEHYPVYNAVLHFDYNDFCLNMLTGIRVFDSLSAENGEGLMDSVSALLRFVELAKRDGIICSRLDAVRPGYLQTVVVSGESSLSPVWRIETDTGVFLINAETGVMESSAA